MADDPFREQRLGIQTLRKLYTDCSTLGMHTVGQVPRICESIQRTVYGIATGDSFPKDAYRPWHEPKILMERMGTFPFYSPKLQAFFTRGQGRALADVEYGGTPYNEYVKPRNRTLAGELVNGIELYLDETVQLVATNPEFLAAVVANKPRPKKPKPKKPKPKKSKKPKRKKAKRKKAKPKKVTPTRSRRRR